jgi:recombinational DNA repair protein RecT
MQGPTKERWKELCKEAAIEQDPRKLLELTDEINRLLEEKEERLLANRKKDSMDGETPDDRSAAADTRKSSA